MHNDPVYQATRRALTVERLTGKKPGAEQSDDLVLMPYVLQTLGNDIISGNCQASHIKMAARIAGGAFQGSRKYLCHVIESSVISSAM